MNNYRTLELNENLKKKKKSTYLYTYKYINMQNIYSFFFILICSKYIF
jgi:hypothetical protein